MWHEPQVEQRGMNSSSHMFNNLSNMLPSAHRIQQAPGDKSNLLLSRAPWQIPELMNTTILISYVVCTEWLGFSTYAADVCPLQAYGWNKDNRLRASFNKYAIIAKTIHRLRLPKDLGIIKIYLRRSLYIADIQKANSPNKCWEEAENIYKADHCEGIVRFQNSIFF